MNIPKYSLTHRSIVMAFVAVLLAIGLMNFGSMSRREDPEITIRETLIVTPWPGVNATRVEQLITEPIEALLLEIREIETVESESMVGMSVIKVTAEDSVEDTDQVWDDVRAKINSIREQLPKGAQTPMVNSDFGDVYEIVFALSQDETTGKQYQYSYRDLEKIAEKIENAIEPINSVARVEFWGVQPENIYIEYNSSELGKIDITPAKLKDVFQSRNIVFSGGELDTKNARYGINPSGEFTSVEQIGDLIVGKIDGKLPVKLKDLPITIERRYEEPFKSLTSLTTPSNVSNRALVIGVSMKSGRNISTMNEQINEVLSRLHETVIPPDVSLKRINDLPRQVSTRIVDFEISLMEGVLIVLAVALFAMGWRPALIMATAVPLSMIGSFAVVRYFGIDLEQFSIASLIIALGMVVDNAIVVTDNVVRLIHQGKTKIDAAIEGAQELAIPLLTSTLTTVSAFLPMLTLEGNAGEYIASLPVVVATTLLVSYLIAMMVTPIMCVWILTEDRDAVNEGSTGNRWLALYDGAIRWCLDRPGKVVAIAVVALMLSTLLIPMIGSQFFPAGSRDQFFIKIWLPEGSPINATERVVREVEEILKEESQTGEDPGQHRLENSVSFVGSGGPRLMLTQEPEFSYPYYGFILVNTTNSDYTDQYAQAIRKRLNNYAGARITVDQFMLGPPIKDSVAFRLTGPNSDVIAESAQKMVALFKQTPGVVNPYSNLGNAANHISIEIDTDAANLAGVSNADIALSTSTLLSGAMMTHYRVGDHLVPVLLRAHRDKREALSDLNGVYVNGQYGKVPLNSISKIVPSLEPSMIARRNGLPSVTVGSRVEEGILANEVSSRVQSKLEALVEQLPPGYTLEFDGELEETVKTQSQVIRAVGISMIAMFLILIIQYNSLSKPFIIMAAIPLGLIGVILGLYITGWAMGFMAMLGLLSLGGIVINNAIVLLDFIESNMKNGQELRLAVASAGRARMNPILLTTATTIGGLLPLSLSGEALFAPMTNGMIFGLIVSTVLTLFVIPSLYVLMMDRSGSSPDTELNLIQIT